MMEFYDDEKFAFWARAYNCGEFRVLVANLGNYWACEVSLSGQVGGVAEGVTARLAAKRAIRMCRKYLVID